MTNHNDAPEHALRDELKKLRVDDGYPLGHALYVDEHGRLRFCVGNRPVTYNKRCGRD